MKTIPLVLALTIAVLLSGCGGLFKGKKEAEEKVAEFHKLYNEGKEAEIYSAGTAKLKGATTEKEFLEFLGAMQRKLGKVTSTSNTGLNFQSHNLKTTLVLTQKTTFEQGTGTETFTFAMEDDKAVLQGYHVNSKELIVK